jgi:hypothetical protein
MRTAHKEMLRIRPQQEETEKKKVVIWGRIHISLSIFLISFSKWWAHKHKDFRHRPPFKENRNNRKIVNELVLGAMHEVLSL